MTLALCVDVLNITRTELTVIFFIHMILFKELKRRTKAAKAVKNKFRVGTVIVNSLHVCQSSLKF